MKLTTAQLRKLIKQSLKESYGNLSPDDDTEMDMSSQRPDENDMDDANRSSERQLSMEMDKKRFVKNQILDWVHEFDAVDQGEMEIIAEILKDAYDEIGHALEMDNTGLYENKKK